jgi:hypothetical protein
VSTNADMKFYLSGTGNTNPFQSYGGPITATQVQTDQLQNVWNDILPDETLTTGFTDYRCIYIKNTNTLDPLSNIHLYWATDDPYTDLEISHRGINTPVERLNTVFTSPSTTEIGVPIVAPSALEIIPEAVVNTNSFGIKKFYDDPATPRYFTSFTNSGTMGATDGYRYNWVMPLNCVSTEVSALIKITKTGNDFVSFKLGGGNHNDSAPNDACCYDIGIPQNAQNPGSTLLRKECPHPDYHSCSNVSPLFAIPTLTNKEVGLCCIKLNQANGSVLIQAYVNMTPVNAAGTINNDTWQKYMEYTDTGGCFGSPYLTPHGSTRQDTIRIDSATYTLRFGSAREIVTTVAAPPGPPLTCPTGQHLDPVQNKCVPDEVTPTPNPVQDPWLKSTTSYATTGAIIPSLPANAYIGIWLRRIIPPNVTKLSIDTSELIAEGTGVTA